MPATMAPRQQPHAPRYNGGDVRWPARPLPRANSEMADRHRDREFNGDSQSDELQADRDFGWAHPSSLLEMLNHLLYH
jgi:hypothetical protein